MIQLKKCVCACAFAAMLLAGCSGAGSADKTVRESVTYELGDKVTLNAEEFIINANESDLQDASVTSSLTTDPDIDYIGFTKEVKTKGKDFLEVGEYPVKVQYGGKTYTSKIVVKDTTPPSFVSAPQSVVVAAGDTKFDPAKRFRITDKDKFTVDMEGEYDLDTPGSYDVTILATDVSGNKSSISITMKVVDGEQVITSEDQIDEDFNDINEAAQAQEEDSEMEDNSQSSSSGNSSSQGSDDENDQEENGGSQDQEKPDDSSSNSSETNTACSATNVTPGSPYYYSFDEAYAAGTAWNQQSPSNYFFYLVGTDDCGQTIYVVTFGSDGSSGTETGPDPNAPEVNIPSNPNTSEDEATSPASSQEDTSKAVSAAQQDQGKTTETVQKDVSSEETK